MIDIFSDLNHYGPDSIFTGELKEKFFELYMLNNTFVLGNLVNLRYCWNKDIAPACSFISSVERTMMYRYIKGHNEGTFSYPANTVMDFGDNKRGVFVHGDLPFYRESKKIRPMFNVVSRYFYLYKKQILDPIVHIDNNLINILRQYAIEMDCQVIITGLPKCAKLLHWSDGKHEIFIVPPGHTQLEISLKK